MLQSRVDGALFKSGIGQRLQAVKVGVLGAKGQMGDNAGGCQQGYSGLGEAFGRAERPRQRQLEHKVRAAVQRAFCAQMPGSDSWFASLDKIARHAADNGGIRSQTGTYSGDLCHVTGVKWIVFADNTAGFHDFLLTAPPRRLAGLRRRIRLFSTRSARQIKEKAQNDVVFCLGVV